MDYKSKLKVEPEVNLIDIIWELLSQWKAVLVVSIVVALLLSGVKYYKDYSVYKDNSKAQEEIAAMAELSQEEQINKALEGLSEEDKLGVEYAVRQKEWVINEQKYLRDSILMNQDPTNQRTLILDYYIASNNLPETTIVSLAKGYQGLMKGEDIISSLRQIIGPELPDNLIAELITVDNNNSEIVVEEDNSIIEVKIVLPDDVDADIVTAAMTEELSKCSDILRKEIGDHEIRLLGASEATLYNQDAVERRTTLNTSTYSMNYNLGNIESALSEEQRVAMNNILDIKRTQSTEGVTTSDSGDNGKTEATARKPEISKKYIVFGFLLGIIIYAIVCFFYSALRGKVTSAEQTEHYSGERLLGELYYKGTYKGLAWLFHSRVVDEMRYKGKMDTSKQFARLLVTIKAICKKNGIGKITIMCLPGFSDDNRKIATDLMNSIKEMGIDIEMVNVDFETIEEKLLSTESAICSSNEEGNAVDLINLSGLLKAYGTHMLGNIYIKGI